MTRLAPIGEWLRQPEHRGDVVLVYVEDDVQSAAAYQSAAATINDTIGDLVYAPPAGPGCPLLPLTLRRQDVLAAGKQVVVMSGCGAGSGDTGAWGSTVFDDSVRSEEGNPDFAGYPACTSPSVAAGDYGTKLVRFYEDSTLVSTAVAQGDPGHRMTVDGIRDMVRCGVNLFGLDQLGPSDPRLEAMVWSWAVNEPITTDPGTCAFDGADGRFHAATCNSSKRRFACVDTTGAWFVSGRSGAQRAGAKTCSRERTGAVFAVPGSGNHAQRLRDAKAAAGVSEVWVAYRVVGGTWQGLAR